MTREPKIAPEIHPAFAPALAGPGGPLAGQGDPHTPPDTSGDGPPPGAPLGPWYPHLSTPPTGVIGRGPAAGGPLAPGTLLYFVNFSLGHHQGALPTAGPRVPALKHPSLGVRPRGARGGRTARLWEASTLGTRRASPGPTRALSPCPLAGLSVRGGPPGVDRQPLGGGRTLKKV